MPIVVTPRPTEGLRVLELTPCVCYAACVKYLRFGRVAAAALPIVLALILATGMLAPPCSAQGQPLRFTVKTIENEAGVRVVLEFSRKPVYEVRQDARRVFITLNEGSVEPPFKKKEYGGSTEPSLSVMNTRRASCRTS